MDESCHEAMRRFFIVVIAGNIQEFYLYAQEKKTEVGANNFYAFGDKFRVFNGERKELRRSLFKVYSFSYDYIYINKNQTVADLKIPFLNSWEVTGSGDSRPDFTAIIDECRKRWLNENPATRMNAAIQSEFYKV